MICPGGLGSPGCGCGFTCFFTRFIPETISVFSFLNTLVTCPICPLSFPAVTTTRSPVNIFHFFMRCFEASLTCFVTCLDERRNVAAADMMCRPFSLFGLDFLADSHKDKISLSLSLFLCVVSVRVVVVARNEREQPFSLCVCVCVFVSIQQRERALERKRLLKQKYKCEEFFLSPKRLRFVKEKDQKVVYTCTS